MDTNKVFEYPVKEHWRQPRCLIGTGAWELAARRPRRWASSTSCS